MALEFIGDEAPDFQPLYAQVKGLILQRIIDGDWKPDEVLPSEFKLAYLFGVSQGTVRKALNDLAAENVVIRQQGKGTLVAANNPQRELFHFIQMTDQEGARQLPTSSRVLSCKRQRASEDDLARLKLRLGAKVIQIERVRTLGEKTAIAESIAVSARLFPGLEAGGGVNVPHALYQHYQDGYAVSVHRVEEALRAVTAGPRDAELLGLTPGQPLLEIDRVAIALDGKPVEWRITRCDTQDTRYVSSLV
jgi:GntR family transcriptional regulator